MEITFPECGKDACVHDLLAALVWQALQRAIGHRHMHLPFVRRDEQEDTAIILTDPPTICQAIGESLDRLATQGWHRGDEHRVPRGPVVFFHLVAECLFGPFVEYVSSVSHAPRRLECGIQIEALIAAGSFRGNYFLGIRSGLAPA